MGEIHNRLYINQGSFNWHSEIYSGTLQYQSFPYSLVGFVSVFYSGTHSHFPSHAVQIRICPRNVVFPVEYPVIWPFFAQTDQQMVQLVYQGKHTVVKLISGKNLCFRKLPFLPSCLVQMWCKWETKAWKIWTIYTKYPLFTGLSRHNRLHKKHRSFVPGFRTRWLRVRIAPGAPIALG
jgi:hypothetical protein